MVRLTTIAQVCAMASAMRMVRDFEGQYFSGSGDEEYLQLLDVARTMWDSTPLWESVPQLYSPAANSMVEGPTWEAWWTQNSYGPTYTALPFLQEPVWTFVQNSQNFWFDNIGDGNRTCNDCNGEVAPDGCLCDDGEPTNCDYKQGDGIVTQHDWALEETLSAVIMQSELLLVSRDATAIAHYLPLFNRTLNLIDSRRDTNPGPYQNMLLSGDASNLLAPSYNGYIYPNGTRGFAYLTGMAVSYLAALNRVIELCYMTNVLDLAAVLEARHAAVNGALMGFLEPKGNYFVKSIDPDNTLHGVVGQAQHGYLEASCNHDAIAFRIVNDSLSETIMNYLVKEAPSTGIRPYNFTVANVLSLDDMEEPPTSWLWAVGNWVNGGVWSTCEARMMLAYYRTNRSYDALNSMRTMMSFANAFRMDNPLTNFGSQVYQPSEPINLVYDNYGVPSSLIRGLFNYEYSATSLVLRPQLPATLTSLTQKFPIRFGWCWLWISTVGAGAVTAVSLNGVALSPSQFNASTVTLNYAPLACGSGPAFTNVSVALTLGAGAAIHETTNYVSEDPVTSHAQILRNYPRHAEPAFVEAAAAAMPAGQLLWL